MAKDKKQAGTCPCPIEGCKVLAKVYKFKAASDDARRQRMAGKCYLECSTHGTLGLRGNAAIQEHIMEHGEIWGANHVEEKPPAAPPAASAPPTPAPAPAPKPVPAAPARKLSEFDQWMQGK